VTRIARLVATVCLGVAGLQAQEPQPLLRVSFEPGPRVLVGQPLTLHVELLTPSWFPKPPQFPTLEIANAVTVLPEGSLNLNTSVDGNSYAGLRRSYLIYPQATGEFTLPQAEVEFVYALPNARPSEPTSLAFPPETFEAYIPAEAAGMASFLATTRLSVKQELDPEPTALKEGDSFRRTITIEADQTFAMFLPPVEWSAPEGIRVYPDPPKSTDRGTGRGGFVGGQRVDAAVYVAREAGAYSLPEIEVSWWDLNTNQARTETLSAIEFQVEENPNAALDQFDRTAPPAPDEERAVEPAAQRDWGEVAAGLVLLALVVWLTVRRLRREDSGPTPQQREAESFRAFEQACGSNDPAASLARLQAWLDQRARGEAITVGEFAARSGDPKLRELVEDLNRRLFAREGGGAAGWEGQAFYRSVAKARQRSGADAAAKKASVLPALNP